MLRRTVEYENVDAELREKRAEFKRRMEICAKRQLELQKRQQAVRLLFQSSLIFFDTSLYRE